MSTDRPIQIDEFNRLATAWLAEGPTELNDHVLDAALASVHVTGQRRPLSPWGRPRTVVRSQAATAWVALSATLVALVVGGAYLLSQPPHVGPASSPSPSATTSSTGASGMVPFISPQYGYTVQVPATWSVTTATSDWHPTSELAPLGTPTADVFVVGDASAARRAAIVAEAQPSGTTSKQWTDHWEAFFQIGGHCFGSATPWTDVTVAGLAARTFSWRCNDSLLGQGPGDYDEYIFLASGRGFVISGAPAIVQQLVRSFGSPPVAPGITAWTTFTSAIYGTTFGYPSDWSVRAPATRNWQADDHFPAGELPYADTFVSPGEADAQIGLIVWQRHIDVFSATADLKALAVKFCAEVVASSCATFAQRAAPLDFDNGTQGGCAIVVPTADRQYAFLSDRSSCVITEATSWITVIVISRADDFPSASRYGGSMELLKSILTTTSVWRPGQQSGT